MTDQRIDDNEPSEKVYGVTGLEISVDAVLADLTRLDQLRIKHEQNKRDLVGGHDPISDDSFLEWMHATHGNRVDLEELPQLHSWHNTSTELSEAEKLLRERLSGWHRQTITEFIHLFPSLLGAAGSDPFLDDKFSAWIRDQADPQATHAGRFVLSIWERDPEQFNLSEAFAAWDDGHRQAYVQWLKRPVMPHREFWGEI